MTDLPLSRFAQLGEEQQEALRLGSDRELARRSLPGAVSYLVLYGVALAATPFRFDHPRSAAVVGGALVLLGLLRIALALGIERFVPGRRRRWRVSFRIGAFASGGIWGVFCGLTVASYGHGWVTLFLVLLSAGLVAGATNALAPDPLLAGTYPALTLGPPVILLAARGEPLGLAVAAVVVVFAGYMLLQARQQSRWYWGAAVDNAYLALQARDLEQARAEAEAASRAKGDFVAHISHEIRTPLNGVVGMADVLLSTSLTPEQRECAELLSGSADALLGIVDDVLDFSKIEAGKMEIEPIPFDLRVVVEDTAALFAPRADAKGLEMVVHYPPDLPTRFVADPGRLRQALSNLLGNAVKFTRRGYVAVHVSSERSSSAPPWIRITVEDTGVGIPAEQLAGVFGAFAQADRSTTRRFGGTGLGLAITRQLASLMGGQVTVESREGEGTRFCLDLPLPLDSGSAPEAAPPSAQCGERFLLIDPNRLSRQVLTELLRPSGAGRAECGSCQEALTLLDAAAQAGAPYAAVFINSDLPDASGLECAHAVRAHPAGQVAALVLLTALGKRGEAREAAAAGIDAYLTKPLRRSQVLGALALVAKRVGRGRERDLVTRHTVAEAAHRDVPTTLDARVLLVDDNPVGRLVAVSLLREAGCDVVEAADGRTALARLESEEIDLLVTDVEMPGMDGFQLLRAVRDTPSRAARRLPVLALSAHAGVAYRERCLAAGFDACLSKPLRRETLRATLSSLLAGLGEPNPSVQPVAEEVFAAAGGDREFAAELAQAFLDDYPRMMAAVRRAVADENAGAVCEAAHALKGAVSHFGPGGALRASRRLEAAGRNGRPEEASAALVEVEGELAALLQGLGALTAGRRQEIVQGEGAVGSDAVRRVSS